jgi:sirohydrochlorin ferrochelatase
MKQFTVVVGVIIVISILTGNLFAEEKPGLLIVAHGSPAPAWNQPVLDLEKEVSGIMQSRYPGLFSSVKVALMEFAEPSVTTAILKMEKDGTDRIYVLPLFVAPSNHTLYDLPAILGLYSDKDIAEQMKEEGINIVNADIRITIGPTPDAEVIKAILFNRLQEVSVDPASESIVILAHGSRMFEPAWTSLITEIGAGLCAETGIGYFDHAFIGMGQGFLSKGVPAIRRAQDKSDRVLVLGLYMVSGAAGITQRWMARLGHTSKDGLEFFAGENVVFEERGLLPDRRMAEWIVDKAIDWAEINNPAQSAE